MTDSFAPPRQRPAPAPDPLSVALSIEPGEPPAAEIAQAEAIAEAGRLLEDAARGDLTPWQLSRAIDLARQFPDCEKLQIAAARLTQILRGAHAAAACWRDMLGRWPASTRILTEYAAVLHEIHGREGAMRIIESYIGDRADIDDPGMALRAARALHRLGDQEHASRLLVRFESAEGADELLLQLARWREEVGDITAAEALLERIGPSRTGEAMRRRLRTARTALDHDALDPRRKDSAQVRAIEKLLEHGRKHRPDPASRGAVALGSVGIIGSTLGGGGAERQLVRTALGLAATPANRLAGPLTVYCRKLDSRRSNDFYLPALERAGIRIVDYRRVPRFGGNAGQSSLSGLRDFIALLPPHMREGTERLTDLLRHDAPDIVQIWQDGTIFAAGLAALLAGIPRIVLNVRTMPPTQRIERAQPEQTSLYRGLLAMPGVALAANSRITAHGYEDWLALPRGSVAVIPNGVDPLPPAADPFEEQRWRAFDRETGGGFVIGGVMRLDDNKRPLEWLAIAAELAAQMPDARFVLVGDGPLRAAAEAFACRRNIAGRTLFVGRSTAVGFWLECFDALVLTSRHEGTPNVLIEAQLAGRPVLTTPAGGAPDAVAPLAANLVLEDAERPGRAAAARHLQALAKRSEHAVANDAEALRRWAARFSVPRMIERTLDLFGAPR